MRMMFEFSLCHRNSAGGAENELGTSLATESVRACQFVPMLCVFGYCKVRSLQKAIEQPWVSISHMPAMKSRHTEIAKLTLGL